MTVRHSTTHKKQQRFIREEKEFDQEMGNAENKPVLKEVNVIRAGGGNYYEKQSIGPIVDKEIKRCVETGEWTIWVFYPGSVDARNFGKARLDNEQARKLLDAICNKNGRDKIVMSSWKIMYAEKSLDKEQDDQFARHLRGMDRG